MSTDMFELLKLNKLEVLKWAEQSPYKFLMKNENLLAQIYYTKVLKKQLPEEVISGKVVEKRISELKPGSPAKIRAYVVWLDFSEYDGCSKCFSSVKNGRCSKHPNSDVVKRKIGKGFIGDESGDMPIVLFDDTINRYNEELTKIVGSQAVMTGRVNDRGEFMVRSIKEVIPIPDTVQDERVSKGEIPEVQVASSVEKPKEKTDILGSLEPAIKVIDKFVKTGLSYKNFVKYLETRYGEDHSKWGFTEEDVLSLAGVKVKEINGEKFLSKD